MAVQQTSSSGGSPALAFIVGGLFVIVAIIAWFLFANGSIPGVQQEVNMDVELPAPSPSTPQAPPVPSTPVGN